MPGNHDGDAERMLRTFGSRAGLHEIGPYRFMVFADRYAPGDFCTRSEDDRRALAEAAAADCTAPIVVLQHNPMNPEIPSDEYPYMLTNRREVMEDYQRAGVMLSLSGHAHWGQALNFEQGVAYFTCPALCESPYHYAVLTLRGARSRPRCTSSNSPRRSSRWLPRAAGRHRRSSTCMRIRSSRFAEETLPVGG